MSARLEFRNGRPAIVSGGKALSYAAYSAPGIRTQPDHRFAPANWQRDNGRFVESGFRLFSISPVYTIDDEWGKTRFWAGENDYPDCGPDTREFCLDRQAEWLSAAHPDIRLWLRFGDNWPQAWMDANPREAQQGPPGTAPVRQASMASEKGLRDLCRFIRRVVDYCEAQPWADRLVAYSYMPSGEGIPRLPLEGHFFDRSPVMQEAFRGFLKRRYGTDDALCRAWGGDASLTLAGVGVPSDEQWQQARQKVLHWPKPGELQFWRDYVELQCELHLHWYRTVIRCFHERIGGRRLFGIDFAKQPLLGWQHNLSFWGSGPGPEFHSLHAAGGALDIGGLLDEPGLDFVNTPADYTARANGFAYEAEGVADSMAIRGKIHFLENDCRTHNPDQEDDTLGAWRDMADTRAGLLRNLAWGLTRGHMDYLMVAGGRYFDDPDIHAQAIRHVRPIYDLAPHLPHRETEHAVAFVIDDGSPLFEDGTSGYQNLAVIWQRIRGLAHCGIPYRLYLLSDLANAHMPDYRCYFFPNLFMIDEARHELLRRKVLRDGRLAIFGPGTGVLDGRERSAAAVSRLLGVEMELFEKSVLRHVIVSGDDPVVGRLPAALTYGDTQPYGPLLLPRRGAVEAAGGRVLGWGNCFWGANRPGLFLRDTGDAKVAWSAAMPLPAALIRELAREGGCHVWCEEDDVVYASDTVAALHSMKPGARTLRLPSPRTVWDLVSRERLGVDLTAVAFEVHPPCTRLFYFGPDLPAGLSQCRRSSRRA